MAKFNFPNREEVNLIRDKYPIGTRIELVFMDDLSAPPVGTKGTVRGVDSMGDIMVNWDNGSTLNIVYGVDFVRKI